MNDENAIIQLDEISIKSIFRDLVKNGWVIVLAAISAWFLVTGYYSLIYTPEYTASATMVVSAKGNSSNSTYTNLAVSAEMADVFQNVFSSNILKKLVQEHIDEELEEFTITSSVVSETNLLVVRVTASTPRTAYLILKAVIEYHPEVSEYVFDNAVLDVLENPRVPMAPSNSFSISKYQKLALLAGAFLAAAAIGCLSILRGTLKTEQQARRKLDGTCLALIGHEEKNRTVQSKIKRQNKSILITNPLVSFGYTETFQKLAFRLQYEMQKKGEKVLLVSSVNENEGKSTVAVNIALALAQSGKKVALVDLDLRRPAVYKIFEQANPGQRGFWKTVIPLKGRQELSVLLNSVPVRNSVDFLYRAGMNSQLEKLKKEMDYIILDSSPMNVAADAELVTSYADAAIMVARQDWAYIQDVNYYISILKETGVTFIGYVLNDFENNFPVGGKQYHYGYGGKYGKYGKYGYSNAAQRGENE